MRFKLLILLLLLGTAVSSLALTREFKKLIPAVESKQYNQWSNSELFRLGVETLNSYDADNRHDNVELLDAAISCLEQEVAQHPGNGYAACNLAIAKLRSMDAGESSGDYDYVDYVDSVETAEVLELKAKIQELKAREEALLNEACQLFKRSISLIPAGDASGQCVAHRGLAVALVEQEADSALIINTINKAIALHPCKAAYVTRIYLHITIAENIERQLPEEDQGEYHKDQLGQVIIADIEDFYNHFPNDPEACAFMILRAQENRDPQGVVDYCDKFFENVKNADAENLIFDEMTTEISTMFKKERGRALMELGRNADAVDDLLEAGAKDELNIIASENPSMVMDKIKQRMAAGDGELSQLAARIAQDYLHDYKEALQYYEMQLKDSPADANTLHSIAQCYYMLGDVDNALLYAEATDRTGGYTTILDKALLGLGRVDEVIKRHEDRVAMADMIEIDAREYMELGYCYLLKRDWQRAESCLGKSVAMGDEYNVIPALYYRGIALKAMGKKAEARKAFDEALEHENIVFEYEHLHALALGEVGKAQEAREVMESVIEHQDFVSTSNYDIACDYAALGDKDKMLQFMQLHFEKEPHNLGLIDKDWRLDGVRNLPEFKRLIAQQKEKFNFTTPARKK